MRLELIPNAQAGDVDSGVARTRKLHAVFVILEHARPAAGESALSAYDVRQAPLGTRLSNRSFSLQLPGNFLYVR